MPTRKGHILLIRTGPIFVNSEGSQFRGVLLSSNRKDPNSKGSYFCQLGGVPEILFLTNAIVMIITRTWTKVGYKVNSIKILLNKQTKKDRKPVTVLVTCLLIKIEKTRVKSSQI